MPATRDERRAPQQATMWSLLRLACCLAALANPAASLSVAAPPRGRAAVRLAALATPATSLSVAAPPLNVRAAVTVSDLDAATALKASARPLTALLLRAADDASGSAKDETRKTLREMLCKPGDTQLLARDADDAVVGTCAVSVRDEVATLPRRAHLVDLFVAEDCRRRGVASSLLRTAIATAAAEGLPCITLEVESDNAAARALYDKFGFAGDSLRSPLNALKYGRFGWNRHLLRLELVPEV